MALLQKGTYNIQDEGWDGDDQSGNKGNQSFTVTIKEVATSKVSVSEESDEEMDDAVINLTIESSSLANLRRYLVCTASRIPQNKTLRTVVTLFRYFILLGHCLCYANDLGAFDNRTLVEEEWQEPVTAVKNAVWSLRFVLLYGVGMIYFPKCHLEKTLSDLRLTRKYWKKARKTIRKIMFALVLFVFVLPITLRVVQMVMPTEQQKPFHWWNIALHVTLSLLSRFFALPLFVAFIHEIYLIYTQIRLYKHNIQRCACKGQSRNDFIDIMGLIRSAERVFQTFLVVQVTLLMVVLIPAVISLAERINEEGRYNQTYVYAPNIQSSKAKLPRNAQSLIELANISQSQHMVYLLTVPLQETPNVTLKQDYEVQYVPKRHTTQKLDTPAIVKAVINALAVFLEMFVLCSLPLFLLAKVSKVMTQLPETVQMLKFRRQEEKGYMIQNKEDLADVLKFLETGRGIQVLDMNLTSVKAALITLLMPFLTTVIHLMLVHVDIST